MAARRKTPPKTISPDDRTSRYAADVLSGKIVAGPHVRNACRRHLEDLKKGGRRGLQFDVAAADRAFGFFENILRLSEGQFEGAPFRLHPSQAFIVGSLFGWKRKDGSRRFRRAYIEQGKGNGKALALDTPIATPAGWTTMGALTVGDRLFAPDGSICRVVAAHPVSHDRECYAVSFDDGSEILASAEHLWLTEMRSATVTGQPRATRGVAKADWGSWRRGLRTTADIAATLRYANGAYRSANHSVSLAAPLETPAADLPIDPYVLGVWLGDGDSDCGRITIGARDADDTVKAIEATGATVRHQSGMRYRIPGLQTRLRDAGLLKNKHVPEPYMRASALQRWALLQGLLDTDGTISAKGQVEFVQAREELAQSVLELAISLGLKATMSTGIAQLNGRAIGTKWRVSFHPRPDQHCFRLGRKLARQVQAHDRRRLSGDRRIVDCRRIATVPVRCITVDHPSGMFLAGRSMIPTHNSPLCGGIGLLGLCADGEAGAQVYSAAAKREQAGILFADAVKMVKQSPKLLEKLELSGGEGREHNIAYLKNGSFFRPVSRDTGRTGSGPRPHVVLADEVHELPDRTILDTLIRGFKFRRQPLVVMITNSGSDRTSACWEEHEHAIRVAAGNRDARDDDPAWVGEVIDDAAFSYVCALDPGDDPLEDPGCWIKANPLLGVTITKEYLAGVVAEGKAIPGTLNGILRLHFCQWTDAETAWMTRATLEPALADFDPAEHFGAQVYGGCDLSQNQDITALGFVVKTGEVEVQIEVERDGETVVETAMKPTFDAWAECWTPGDTVAQRALRDKAPYETWIRDGHLNAPKGKSISYLHVAQRLAEVAHDYDLQCVAYDRYAFRRGLEPECNNLGLSIEFVEHPQGGTKKGKPTEAMKEAAEASGREPEGLWMPGSVRQFEEVLLEGRIRLKMNPVLVSAIMSAVTEEDKWGNHWLSKERALNKIDAAVAVCMALGAAIALEAQSARSFWETA